MQIQIDWTYLSEGHPLWHDSYCLYAYLHGARDWLLYVGKADRSSVRSRMHGSHKRNLYDDIIMEYGVDTLRVMHGELCLPEGSRRSSALLSDVESLLIHRLDPFGNIQSTQSRIMRPGLRVECVGDWPFRRRRFHDV